MLVRQSAQPSYFAQCDAATAPFDRFAPGQTRVIGHRQQRAAEAQLRIPDCSIAFTERSQHFYRQRLEPAFPIGTFVVLFLGDEGRTHIGKQISKQKPGDQSEGLDHDEKMRPDQGLMVELRVSRFTTSFIGESRHRS